MPHRQRLKLMIEKDGFKSQAKFCKTIHYSTVNLSNYITGGREFPNGDLIFNVAKYRPHWNLLYWFFEKGEMFNGDRPVSGVEESKSEYGIDLKEIQKRIDYLEEMVKNNRDRIELLNKEKK